MVLVVDIIASVNKLGHLQFSDLIFQPWRQNQQSATLSPAEVITLQAAASIKL